MVSYTLYLLQARPEEPQPGFERCCTVSTLICICSTALWTPPFYDWSFSERMQNSLWGLHYYTYNSSLLVMLNVLGTELRKLWGLLVDRCISLLWTMSTDIAQWCHYYHHQRSVLLSGVIASVRPRFFAMFTLGKKLPGLFTWSIQKVWTVW